MPLPLTLAGPCDMGLSAAAYAAAVAADSPVAWWHLGDSGSTAVDSIAGINGTYSGGPALAGSLVVGGDGSHDFTTGAFVAIAGTAALKPVSFTLEAWVNVDVFAADTRPICLASNRVFLTFDATGHLSTTFWNGTTNRSATSTGVLTTGVTYHVAGTWDNTSKVLTSYINGVVDGQATWAANAISYAGSTASAISDESAYSSPYRVDGRIDEVAVYATALSTARILAHYQAGI